MDDVAGRRRDATPAATARARATAAHSLPLARLRGLTSTLTTADIIVIRRGLTVRAVGIGGTTRAERESCRGLVCVLARRELNFESSAACAIGS
eukprot:COSAG02_NODE_6962_length_3261_cov_8.559140_3_plen_94_part_00